MRFLLPKHLNTPYFNCLFELNPSNRPDPDPLAHTTLMRGSVGLENHIDVYAPHKRRIGNHVFD